MLDRLPIELLHKIVLFSTSLIPISLDSKSHAHPGATSSNYNYGVTEEWDVRPPTTIPALSRTCSRVRDAIRYAGPNVWLYARAFERSFDFDAPKRRLSSSANGLWAGDYALAWEVKRRWAMVRRIKTVLRVWDEAGCHGDAWIDAYSEQDVLADLWTIYLMLLENDGRNAVFLVHAAHLYRYTEMLCGVFFGQSTVRRVGWPSETQERALLAWILVVLDPMPADFKDQEKYHLTKLAMRAFAFGSFKYSLGTLPPTYFAHPFRRLSSTLSPSNSPPTTPAGLLPLTTSLASTSRMTWLSPPPPQTHAIAALVPVQLYARTAWLYPPSLAVAAVLWYFRGVEENRPERPPHVASHGHEHGTEHGTSTPSSISSSSSSSSSYFTGRQAETDGWTTPVLFKIPKAHATRLLTDSISPSMDTNPHSQHIPMTGATVTATATIPSHHSQPALTRKFRNALYLRGFNCLSRQLETEWVRRLEGPMRFPTPTSSKGSGLLGFIPGSLEGIWEGGFAFPQFQDYASFLTGERQADEKFYTVPAEELYGMNTQIWRVKEYELPAPQPGPTSPDSHLPPPFSLAGSASSPSRSTGYGGFQSPLLPTQQPMSAMTASFSVASTTSGGTSGSSGIDAQGGSSAMRSSSSSSSSLYEPLTVGKWRDGWLPPAERLQWRLSEDGGGDELEIVETIVAAEEAPPVPNSDPRAKAARQTSTSTYATNSSLGADDEDSLISAGWENERVGLRQMMGPSEDTRGRKQRESTLDSLGSSSFGRKTSAREKQTDDNSVTPVGLGRPNLELEEDRKGKGREVPIPTNIIQREDSTTSSAGGKVNTGTTQSTPTPLRAGEPGIAFGGRRRATDPSTSSKMDPRPNEQSRKRSTLDSYDDVPMAASSSGASSEKVSRYQRWDPNVAWARQAIWGSGPANGQGGRVRRQIRDILIFGESHSAWGDATLRGRVRSHDGLITLVKNYPSRATWIYTGYLVGGESFVGRWRDAETPDGVNGYEGPFAMKRRR